MAFELQDFELQIATRSNGAYPVQVHSPAGWARGELEAADFPAASLQDHEHPRTVAERAEIELRSRGSADPGQQVTPATAASDFGALLYDALFRGEVGNRWAAARTLADQGGYGLRLKLRIEAPELLGVPWEFLYDRDRGRFLCLSTHTPLVRYLNLQDPDATLSVRGPLRILGVACSPSDLPRLDIGDEHDRMEGALEAAIEDGLVELDWLPGQGWQDLQRAMATGTWHIVHFVGHGYFNPENGQGGIAMVGRDGKSRPVTATQLGQFLADHTSLRLVVLNACQCGMGGTSDIFSSVASILVQQGIPAVVAMQYDISDRSAIEFAETFYTYLGEGFAVDAAVTEARKAMSMVREAPGPEWATPVLYMHATNGRIFDVEPRPEGPRDPASVGEPDAVDEPEKRPSRIRWFVALLAVVGLVVAAAIAGVMALRADDPGPTPSEIGDVSERPDGACDPNYSGACVPIATDVDCAGGGGDGPEYVEGPVTVVGDDIYGLDEDGNGTGCD